MEDFFYDSLIYICEHDERGAFGLVINQPLKLTTKKLFKSLQLNANSLVHDLDRVMQGGPVDVDKVFVLHGCLLYTSPSPRDQRGSRMPSSA